MSFTARDPGLRSTTLKALVREALTLSGYPRATASIVITNDETVRALNRDFRESDTATDVLSFPLAEPGALRDPDAPVFLGEIYISLDTARVQARAAKHTLAAEVAHLTVHGLLHLLGYDHDTAAATRAMRAMERKVLRALWSRIAD